MGHLGEVADLHFPGNVFAEAYRQPGRRGAKLARLDQLAQVNDLAVEVGDLDAHGRFAGDALDQDGLGFHRQAKVVDQVGDAAVLDARFRLELERGDHRTGVYLRDRAGDAKLGELIRQSRGPFFKLVFVDALLVVGRTQQRGVRQFVGVDAAPRDLRRRRAARGDGRALLVQSPSPHHRDGFRGARHFGFVSTGAGDACAKAGALTVRRRVLGTPFGFRFGGFRFGLAR